MAEKVQAALRQANPELGRPLPGLRGFVTTSRRGWMAEKVQAALRQINQSWEDCIMARLEVERHGQSSWV